MGTSNFHYEECFFTVTEGDEFTWDDTRANVSSELEMDRFWITDNALDIPSELRSFPATSIGQFAEMVQVLGFDIDVVVIAVTRSGYYEGFNLDYEVEINFESGEYETGEQVWDDMWDYNPSLRGLLTIHKKYVIDSIDNMVKAFSDRLEEVYGMYSDQCVTVGRFSDGTSLIEKVS